MKYVGVRRANSSLVSFHSHHCSTDGDTGNTAASNSEPGVSGSQFVLSPLAHAGSLNIFIKFKDYKARSDQGDHLI